MINPATVALTTHIKSILNRRVDLAQAQAADNAAYQQRRLDANTWLRRWASRQQERINLETRLFWLRCQLEELTQ